MTTPDHAAFYKKQISLTEWLEGIGHHDTAGFRQEDFDKYTRLKILHDIIDLPYAVPHQFPATVMADKDPVFETFVRDHSKELCMVRLVPIDPSKPKLRMRGKTVEEAIIWFSEQTVDPKDYKLYIVPHTVDHSWSTIFVVNENGIFGETINGEHNKLTQGLYENGERPIAFSWNFKTSTWNLDPQDAEAQKYLQGMIAHLKVENPASRERLKHQLDAVFSHDYLCGYFETTSSHSLGTWFIDYNRLLGKMYESFTGQTPVEAGKALVSGQTGSPGRATGRVRIVESPDNAQFQPGEILVCRMTSPDYLPLMQRAAAVVTNLGGILSHAAIVARELKLPCLTATGDATTKLQDGQTVEVDATAGVVRK
jgi:phosphohistidine swiveling domain-containing protein